MIDYCVYVFDGNSWEFSLSHSTTLNLIEFTPHRFSALYCEFSSLTDKLLSPAEKLQFSFYYLFLFGSDGKTILSFQFSVENQRETFREN